MASISNTEVRPERMEERTIVLLGKTGVGKSATGNTILGRNAFESRLSVDSVTQECAVEQREINGKIIRVVDTPGFFDTTRSEEEITTNLGRTFYLTQSGVHAFVLVFSYGEINKQEEEMIMKINEVFGENVTQHLIVIFTHGDQIINIGDLNTSRNEHTRRVLARCGGRYQIFNNCNPNNTQQVTELLEMIESMLRQNRGMCYITEIHIAANGQSWQDFMRTFKNVLFYAVCFFGVAYLGTGAAAGRLAQLVGTGNVQMMLKTLVAVNVGILAVGFKMMQQRFL